MDNLTIAGSAHRKLCISLSDSILISQLMRVGPAGGRHTQKPEMQEYIRRLFSCAAGRQLSIDLRETLISF
jgi:hypothetical protein